MSEDYRKGSKEELSFYVFDNLRASQDGMNANIYRYDTLLEAIKKYNELPKEWTTALGGSIHDTQELDFVQRRQGENVLITDYQKIDFWKDDISVQKALNSLISNLSIQYESNRDLLDGRTILIPLQNSERPLSSYYKRKSLDPAHSEHLTTAINEAFVSGHGWVPFKDLIKMSVEYGYHNPHCPLVTRFNVNYCTEDGKRGQADISTHDFALLKEKTVREMERENSSEPDVMLWARVGMSINVSAKEYKELLKGNSSILHDVLFGKTGQAFLSGETYFPEIDENRELGEMEYYFTEEEIVLKNAAGRKKDSLEEMIQSANERRPDDTSSHSEIETER